MAKSSKYIAAANGAMYVRYQQVHTAAVNSRQLDTRLNVDGDAFAVEFFRKTSPKFRAAFFARMKALQAQRDGNLGAHIKQMAEGSANERR